MSIRFKHLTAVWVALVLCLCGQQAAAEQCDCNLCPDMCGEWEVGAHALYFAPITCSYAYANTYTDVQQGPVNMQNGRALIVPCSADWGFRLFGNYINDCLFMGLSYQWLDVTTNHSFASDNLAIRVQGGFIGQPGKAAGQVAIEYQNVDVRVGKFLWQRCKSALYFYGNARWVDLSHRRSARVVFVDPALVPAEDIQEKSELKGGAIGIGLGGELDVWCNIGTFIDCNVLGVIGERSLKHVRFRGFGGPPTNLSPVEQLQSYPSETCIIPEANFRIGLNYTYVCGCWRLVGEIGYELDYFWHGSVFPDLVGNTLVTNPGTYAPVCEDIGFSGLFFGGRLIF